MDRFLLIYGYLIREKELIMDIIGTTAIEKRRVRVYYALWLIAGVFGAHRFYCGRIGGGAFQLLLSLIQTIQKARTLSLASGYLRFRQR
jgi:hypothetical protein